MSETSQHSFINIALVQARDGVLNYFRPALSSAGLTEQQWRILRLLAANGTMDFQDLSEQTSILRPSLTGVLTRLEQMGLLMRLKPASDQRRVFINLTEKGVKQYDQIAAQMEAAYAALERDFGSNKLQKLNTLLRELSKLGEQYAQKKE
ncbi:homoprotocatechuate degradation operon regulator HpaR [Alysiella crassa]|uniref:Organic hydroperoxide resistance transcriptional regulator n=1 Tax=Alysiella crassa TaxID=153491 RepID=A0A376BS01_9NEIS|nr:homoprotocatechuate degradation operon regulator HpaR [Alysiella crassa]UOP07878.1 homoprotocatechuate degradation operon regulator HpaR [Alysiella crassa]SSY79777.1 Organic hydroperoxide resistance transcriptional regulator [Alysiella crassa]